MDYAKVQAFFPPSHLLPSDEIEPRERAHICCRVNEGIWEWRTEWDTRAYPSGHLTGEPDSLERFIFLRLYRKTRMMTDQNTLGSLSIWVSCWIYSQLSETPSPSNLLRTTVQITRAGFSVSSWLDTWGSLNRCACVLCPSVRDVHLPLIAWSWKSGSGLQEVVGRLR